MRYVILALLLTACGSETTQIVPPAPVDDVSDLVAEYNANREAQGQSPITPGLSCALYTVPNTTTTIQGAVLTHKASFKYVGNFNVPNGSTVNGLPILPGALRAQYKSWIIVKCSGFIVAATANWDQFTLTSDDGSRLFIDGALITDNDGLHGAQSTSGAKFMSIGVHSVQLDFFQGQGNQMLVLEKNSNVMATSEFYH